MKTPWNWNKQVHTEVVELKPLFRGGYKVGGVFNGNYRIKKQKN